jgi:zinc protease
MRTVAVAMLVLFAACAPAPPPRFAFKHAERRGRFANGVRFVLMPDATTEQVEVDVRYDVGSREDPEGKAGLAHLVEHLMFQQRPDGPTSPPLMQSISELSTGFNAYTTWDKTHYMTAARASSMDALLKIEAIRLFYGCQTISPDEFAREREVVRNELRQRAGTPEGQIPKLLLSAIYPAGHAYARPVGGDDRQVATVALEDACAFIARYYAPERATVIVAGRFEVDAAVASIEKWFGRIPKHAAAPRTPVQPFQVASGRVEVALDVEQPSVHVIWPLPPANTPDGEAVRFGLFATMFRVAGKAAEYDFAYQVQPQLLGGELAPAFAISISLRDLGKLDDALAFVRKSARTAYLLFDGASREALEEFRNRRKAAFIAELEPLAARTDEVADLVQSSGVDFDSSELYLFHELDKIGRFDAAQVAAAIKRYVDPDRTKIVVVVPSREGGKGDPRASVRFTSRSDEHIAAADVDPADAGRPIPLPEASRGVTGAQRLTLGNGMAVVLLPVHAMPLVAAHLIFRNAGAAATPDSPALAAAAADFLAMPLDAEAFARTGTNVDCHATSDATICTSTGMSIYQDVVIRGLDRLVVAGTYDQPSIEMFQKHLRGRFTARRAQDTEFSHQVLQALYGPDHPYTRTGTLTPDAMDRVHLDALNAFRRAHYTAGNATLVVVGDFDPVAVERQIRDSFSGWDRGTVDPAVDRRAPRVMDPSGPASGPERSARTGSEIVGVIGSDSPQVRVVIAYPSPAGVDGQAGARSVLATMLDQRAGDLRFKLGSTYGVYARLTTRTGPNAYELGGDVDAERAGESLKAMRDGVAALRRGDQFDRDFVRARRKVVSDLLGESTVTGELARRLGFIALHGLAADHDRALLERVAALSPAQVRALIAQELDPRREVVVVLGDRAHVERAFADAGITGARLIAPKTR